MIEVILHDGLVARRCCHRRNEFLQKKKGSEIDVACRRDVRICKSVKRLKDNVEGNLEI